MMARGHNFRYVVCCLQNLDLEMLQRYIGFQSLLIARNWGHEVGILSEGRFEDSAADLMDMADSWNDHELTQFEILCEAAEMPLLPQHLKDGDYSAVASCLNNS